MFEKLGMTRMAQALASYSGARLGTIAKNVANADTPGYQAMDLPDFAQTVRAAPIDMRATRAGHIGFSNERPVYQEIHAGDSMSPSGNDVSLDIQMMKAVAARQDHEMALAVYRNTSDIVRTSLGRKS